ncbi:serine/threonine protein phosphatase [Planctomycetaceae bacterium SCGC AG-212-D15]|nr:serine/threonine protein phosphatase [Planctomycetaceae bacterium SCGC AG-212-D15]
MDVRIGRCTRIGKSRDKNQDAINVKPMSDTLICLVADGMGGQRAGEIASKRAVEVIPSELTRQLKADTSLEDAKRIIRKTIVHANDDIIGMGNRDKNLKNMGTTVVLAVWQKSSASVFVSGVGDSRGYLMRNKKIDQLTVDHSLAQALVEAKTITPEEARTHRFRNVLWKYLGSKEVGEGPEVKRIAVEPGDRILLCTNGLHGVVSDEGIRDCMNRQSDVQKCAEALCQLAGDSGSQDNTSCIVLEVVGNR